MQRSASSFTSSVFIFITIFFSQALFAQADRLVLVEEFTNASCQTCYEQDPAFNSLLSSNPGTVVGLRYHAGTPGYDPMYTVNTLDILIRSQYYGPGTAPYAYMDGTVITNDCGQFTGAPACLSQLEISNESLITSPFDLTLSHYITADADSVYITLGINALANLSGDFKARIAVVERVVNTTYPPGVPGVTEFHGVMKKMLPAAAGFDLPNSISNGYTSTITTSWNMFNMYDLNEVAIIAWIQDDATREVMQAAYSQPIPLTNYASLVDFTGNFITCTNSISPQAILRNDGLTTLTSAMFTYQFDFDPIVDVNWSGSLNTGETEVVTFPSQSFSSGTHNFRAWVSQVNGTYIIPIVFTPSTTLYHIGSASAVPVIEGFVSTTFPPTSWLQIGYPENNQKWERSSQVGGYQLTTNSAMYSFYTSPPTTNDDLYVKNFNLSNTSEPLATIEFDIAKAKFSNMNDRLQLLASADCGETWTVIYDKADSGDLSTIASTSANWKPSQASNWRTDYADISSLIGNNSAFIKFKAISGNGNNLYIDNINIHYGGPTGVSVESVFNDKSFSLFPNPANETITAELNDYHLTENILIITDNLGREVFNSIINASHLSIDTKTWEPGLYYCRLLANSGAEAIVPFMIVH